MIRQILFGLILILLLCAGVAPGMNRSTYLVRPVNETGSDIGLHEEEKIGSLKWIETVDGSSLTTLGTGIRRCFIIPSSCIVYPDGEEFEWINSIVFVLIVLIGSVIILGGCIYYLRRGLKASN